MNEFEDKSEVQSTVSELSFTLASVDNFTLNSVLSESHRSGAGAVRHAAEDEGISILSKSHQSRSGAVGHAAEDEGVSILSKSHQSGPDVTVNSAKDVAINKAVGSFPNNKSAGIIPRSPNGEDIDVSIKATKRINFMVAGLSGSGKTKYCNRFLQRYFPDFKMQKTSGEPTMKIEERGRCQKMQGKVKIIVTVVDAPGYGDTMNNIDRLTPVEEYIVKQNEIYEKNELFRNQNQMENDSRIHCIFYFFSPHRVTPVDREFLSLLQHKVAVVPIIGKADTMQTHELKNHLRLLQKTLEEEKIQIFDFGETGIDVSWIREKDENEESDDLVEEANPTGKFNRNSNNSAERTILNGDEDLPQLPQVPNIFAVISGVRRYPWGKASEYDPTHSDTQRLHSVLFQEGSIGKLLTHADDIHEAWRRVAQEKEREENIAKALEIEKNIAEEKENLERLLKEEEERRKNAEEEKEENLAGQRASKAIILILSLLIIVLGLALAK